MRRAVGLTSDELETRERVFDGLTARAIRRSLRALSLQSVMTAATEITLSAEPPPPNPTIPAGALGVVTTTWTQEVDDVLFPYVVQTFVDAAEDIHAALPAGVPKITYDLAVTFLANAKNRLDDIGDVVWNDMRTQLALGYEAGESINQLATRLRGVAKISEPRAQTIARTEVVPAANFGSLQQLKVAGFTDDECQKEWLATNDQRTREAHRLADGQRVGVNQPFKVDGDYLQVPGDPAGRYENVVNCRCTVVYVFDDDDVVTAAGFKSNQKRDDKGRWSEVSGTTLAKHYYAGAGFRNLNQALEQGKPLSSVPSRYVTVSTKKDPFMSVEFTAERAVKQLDRAIAGSQLDVDTPLFRGTEAKSPPKVGEIVTSDAYTSTSRDRKRGLSFAGAKGTLWEITAPAGTHALDIDEGPNTHEQEVLLGRKARLRVTGVTKKDGVNVVSAVVETEPLTADARFEALHPRADDGRFGVKSPFTILPKELRGKSGDGMYAPGMWGRYGAAGVMMRHVNERGTPRYLLVQRANPGKNQWKWQLPGGALEQNETPAQGAAREAFEEIGATPELLESLQPRGEHSILRPVEGKPPWRYTNVVADAPEQFTPRVDRQEGELWKAVWLTEEQIREMMTRDRLVAPLAAEIDNILAKYDEPLIACFHVITMTAGSPTVTNQDYYDLVTASSDEWTAADEAKHPRDSEGKFAKKATTLPKKTLPSKYGPITMTDAEPIHINTKVIYTTKYADGAVVAEKNYAHAGPSRLVWDAGQKKFLLQGADADGNWTTVKAYTKKDAYAKFSKETGWFEPHTPVPLTAPPLPAPATPPVAPSKTKTLLAQSPGATPALGAPIKLNTVAIYKTKYADGTVVAEKGDQRLVWSENLKKFNLQQKTPSGNWGPAFGQHLFTKGDAYKKFSKQTGWTQPVAPSAAPVAAPAVPSTLKTGDVDTFKKFLQLPVDKKVAWLLSLTPKDLEKFSPADINGIDAVNTTLMLQGKLSKIEHTNISEALLNMAPLTSPSGSGVVIPDFYNDPPHVVADFFTKLTQDDFDKLSASDQAVIAHEAPFYDVNAPLGQKFSDKIKGFIAGKGGAGAVAQKLDQDIKDVSHLIAPAAFADWFDLHTKGVTANDWDQLDAPQQQKLKLLANEADVWGFNTPKQKIEEWQSATPTPTATVTARPPVKTSVPATVSATIGSKFYVDVHGKIKKVSEIGTPNAPVKNAIYSVITPTQADKLQKSMFADSGAWNLGQIAAIKKYGTSVGYRSMNAVLRDDKNQLAKFSDAQLQDGVKHAVNLQNAMKPLPSSLRLFRGTGAQAFGQNTIAADFTKLKALEGQTLTDKGFFSTTVDETKAVSYDYAKKPIQMIVNTPEGTPAVYADAAIPGHSEHEIILAAGTSYRIDEVRKATAEDRAKFGMGTEHVVVATIVPSTSTSSSPINAPVTPDPAVAPAPAVAPSVMTLVTPSAPTAPTLGPIKASDLKKPMKISTKTIHTTKYQNGAVVGYHKNPNTDQISRLVWNDNLKKFVLQEQSQNDNSLWTNVTFHSKKDAYAAFGKGSNWFEPPAGDSAIGSGGVFGTSSVAPKISTSGPTPSTAVSAPAVKPKPQEKFDVATLQKMHGQIPVDMSSAAQRAIFDRFKKQSSVGFVTLSSTPETLFTALHETLEKHNEDSKLSLVPKLNLLQLLKIVDEQSTNKANAVAKQKDASAPEVTNTNAYEKAIVAWLQTPAGAKFATDLLHPPPPTTVNGHVYKSNFSQAVLDTLAKIKTPGQIGTPDPNAKTFKTLTVSAAQMLQNQMLASSPWTSAQRAALTKYSGSYYSEMNPVVRDLTSNIKYMTDGAKMLAARTAVNIQAGMRPLPESVRVFRRTGAAQFPGLTNGSKYADIKKLEGKLFTDRAPLSTSVSSGTWSGNVHLTIDLPAGTPAAFIKSISVNPSEDEMLLALGLNYRVVSVKDTGYNNVIEVHLRVEA